MKRRPRKPKLPVMHPIDLRKSSLTACIGDRQIMVTAEEAFDPQGKRFENDGEWR